MDTLPRISIVTPSYNQGEFLERTIRSVLDQKYPNLEYFVMDGGSTDDSVAIIERYQDQIDYWVSERDGGQSAAINAGWRRATGDILCWLNSDDYYLPGTLELVGESFAAHSGLALLYGTCERVDAEGRRIGYLGSPMNWHTLLLSRQIIPQPSAFFGRQAVQQIGMLDEELQYSFDYDFLLRLTAKGNQVEYTSRPLAAFTIHPDAKTTRDVQRAKQETYLVRKRHARGLDRLIVAGQPWASRLYHALPRSIRRGLDRLRPKQVRASARWPSDDGPRKAGTH
jgi:glycosyltransferase involved in cell wall biosynthesis